MRHCLSVHLETFQSRKLASFWQAESVQFRLILEFGVNFGHHTFVFILVVPILDNHAVHDLSKVPDGPRSLDIIHHFVRNEEVLEDVRHEKVEELIEALSLVFQN